MREGYTLNTIMVSIGIIGMGIVMMEAPQANGKRPSVDQLPVVKELPDPFSFQNGSRVKSKRDWVRRRSELLGLILRYEYGALPPESESVSATDLSTRTIPGPGATEREVLLTMGPASSVHTHLVLSIPS